MLWIAEFNAFGRTFMIVWAGPSSTEHARAPTTVGYKFNMHMPQVDVYLFYTPTYIHVHVGN